jgi:ADP-ribose pyrophosphatase YjhB (NUDIX family)
VIKDEVFCFLKGTEQSFTLEGNEHPIIFLFVSYLLGHFIFLIGAKFLDDLLYEEISKKRFAKQVESILGSEKLTPKIMRGLADYFFKSYANRSLIKVVRIKAHYLNPLQASEAINAFQWAKIRLNLNHPTANMEVQRHEVNSKFFRSLLIVFLFFILWCLWFGRWDIAIAILPLVLLASWRYIEQRMKAVRLAYWYIISLEAEDHEGYRENTKNGETEFTHAGGIVFREKGKKKEFLLVKTKKPPYEWVLPKGHIELGESSKETAIREVREETGVWAKIIQHQGKSKFELNRKVINVEFFLMESLEVGKSPEGRNRGWFCLDIAIEKLEHEDNKSLLRLLKI